MTATYAAGDHVKWSKSNGEVVHGTVLAAGPTVTVLTPDWYCFVRGQSSAVDPDPETVMVYKLESELSADS